MTIRNLIQISNNLAGCALVFMLLSVPALAHTGEGHDTATTVVVEDKQRDEILKLAISLLNELIETRKAKGEKWSLTLDSSHHDDTSEKSELAVWVELHSNQTHAHVKRPDAQEESWLLEGIKYTDEEAVVKAIADKSGLSEHDIEKIIVFPTGEVDEKGDSQKEHDEDTEQDLSGIHIMSDGKIMWGNGTLVNGASITADSKVKLSDGTVIVPKFDLR